MSANTEEQSNIFLYIVYIGSFIKDFGKISTDGSPSGL